MTDKTIPAISLIIAVHNRPDFLEKIFTSLDNQTLHNFEVIVADDGSGPQIAELIEDNRSRFCWPIVHVYHKHKGFRKTVIVNSAVSKASANFLVFIDGDCILHHKFLERHYIRSRKGFVLSGRRVRLKQYLSCKITLEDIKSRRLERFSFWWHGCYRGSRKYGFYAPWLFKLKNAFSKHYEILGSNFSVFKEDFLRINGYDERIIGRGLEDNNLCARFALSGICLRSISYEAIQYHLYHEGDACPHSAQTIKLFKSPESWWTPYGIVKKVQD